MIILGIMSGTSLDGIDFALCDISESNNKFSYKILKTSTISYPKEWITKLKNAQNLSAFEFIKLHKNYGKFIGEKANIFLENTAKPEYISSHGHTIFHQAEKQITFQIGDGSFIASETNISTICDFRNLDTALRGQGAPLVPIGDKLLFSEYKFCINLGGFANISFQEKNNRIAYDICPVNFIGNYFSQKLGLEYDKNGELAKKGNLNSDLFDKLNSIHYYFKESPKSLASEDVYNIFLPIFSKFNISENDKLRTLYEHVAYQISESTKSSSNEKILLTGGGTHNKFLITLIQKFNKNKIIIPEKEIIDFKEAIIFAFLGYLRVNNQINCLSSATGAKKDNIGGVIFKIK